MANKSEILLSASGFRKVFAQSGDPESREESISYPDSLLCTAIAYSFFEEKLEKGSTVILARDTRPTGKIICQIIGRTLVYLGAKVFYSGISGVDELLAQSIYGKYSAFAYISASHNPIGHNGMKFGTMGGVFNQDEIAPVIKRIKVEKENIVSLEKLYRAAENIVVQEDAELKKESLANYRDFIIRANMPEKVSGVGIVADFNGSARCVSIDKSFLAELGVKTCFVNDEPGKVVHGIIPERENLEVCRQLLQKKHDEDPDFILGYVPDNDGDRGNLVYMDSDGKAKIMKAQEVFALCVYSALEFGYENKARNLAVAVNCGTSLRINDIADLFGAKVFRAEIGESNVVNLSDSLRSRGYNVPILGEGPNGGNITYPSRARDPMNTLMCMLRILKKMTISQAFAKLPEYTTTDASSPEAILHLDTDDYARLKAIYERNFNGQWQKNRSKLFDYGIESYKEYQTEGIVERCEAGKGDRGGLKMLFFDNAEKPVAFIWMRPSATEPLFRILADVKGKKQELHDFLLSWQKSMILDAQNEMLNSHSSES